MLRQPAQGVAGRGNWGIAAVHGVPAALKRLGLGMRPGTTLKVVEDTDSHVHLVLPPRPAGDLSEQALARKAADAGAHLACRHAGGLCARSCPRQAVPASIPRRSRQRVTGSGENDFTT